MIPRFYPDRVVAGPEKIPPTESGNGKRGSNVMICLYRSNVVFMLSFLVLAPCQSPTGATPTGTYQSGTNVAFSCDNGDAATLECNDGQWSDPDFNCGGRYPSLSTDIVTCY